MSEQHYEIGQLLFSRLLDKCGEALEWTSPVAQTYIMQVVAKFSSDALKDIQRGYNDALASYQVITKSLEEDDEHKNKRRRSSSNEYVKRDTEESLTRKRPS